MRLLIALALLAALVAAVPAASASVALPSAQELPVGVRVYHDGGTLVGAGAGFTGCCDLPWFSVGGGVDQDGDARVWACYQAYVGFCLIDIEVPVVG